MNARIALATVITAIWAAGQIKGYLDSSFHPAPELTTLVMIVAGFFFASGLRKDDP